MIESLNIVPESLESTDTSSQVFSESIDFDVETGENDPIVISLRKYMDFYNMDEVAIDSNTIPVGGVFSSVDTFGFINFTPGDDYNHLAKGEYEYVTISIQSIDEDGNRNSTPITIRINGEDDVPVAKYPIRKVITDVQASNWGVCITNQELLESMEHPDQSASVEDGDYKVEFLGENRYYNIDEVDTDSNPRSGNVIYDDAVCIRFDDDYSKKLEDRYVQDFQFNLNVGGSDIPNQTVFIDVIGTDHKRDLGGTVILEAESRDVSINLNEFFDDYDTRYLVARIDSSQLYVDHFKYYSPLGGGENSIARFLLDLDIWRDLRSNNVYELSTTIDVFDYSFNEWIKVPVEIKFKKP